MLFQQIVADPAWAYANRLSGKGRTVFGSGASGKYRTERIGDMAAFRVEDVADPAGCQLYMWATGPFLADALFLMGAWRFSFVTVSHVWVKVRKERSRADSFAELLVHGWPQMVSRAMRRLPGHYTASNAEFVLLGSRGDTQLPAAKMQSSVIVSPCLTHSRKPDDVHEYVERCYPSAQKLELFARRERNGWTTLGDEIDGRDLRDSLLALALA